MTPMGMHQMRCGRYQLSAFADEGDKMNYLLEGGWMHRLNFIATAGCSCYILWGFCLIIIFAFNPREIPIL
jgi:hypothetical protein